jgi:hypothetical protein
MSSAPRNLGGVTYVRDQSRDSVLAHGLLFQALDVGEGLLGATTCGGATEVQTIGCACKGENIFQFICALKFNSEY